MTEIERLQAMLTERGIDWWSDDDGMTHWGGSVAFSDGDGISVATRLRGVTAEQAVESTLGSGECHEEEDEDTGFICCSECGVTLPEDYTVYYCWSCGRKIAAGGR